MLNQKQIIALLGLGVFVILYVMFVLPSAEDIGKYISEKNPAKLFVMTLFLSSLLIAVRVLKKRYEKYRKTGDLAEWFSMLFIPVPLAIEVIIYKNYSLYWIYFPYITSSVFWISIGIYKGGYNIRKWEISYQNTFFIGCFILIAIGILIHLYFDTMFPFFPSKFFPWLSE